MSAIERTIIQVLEDAIDFIQSELESKGFNYTGFASDSMTIVPDNDAEKLKIELWGADYIEFLASGRGETRKKGDGTATKAIFEWVEKKLAPILSITDEDEIELLKFAVAGKIHKEGTKVYRGQRTGINIEKARDEAEQKVMQQISDSANIDVLVQLDKYAKLFAEHKYTI